MEIFLVIETWVVFFILFVVHAQHWQYNILIRHHFPAHMMGVYKTKNPFVYAPGFKSTSLTIYCVTQGVYRNRISVHIGTFWVVEYLGNEDVTVDSGFLRWCRCRWIIRLFYSKNNCITMKENRHRWGYKSPMFNMHTNRKANIANSFCTLYSYLFILLWLLVFKYHDCNAYTMTTVIPHFHILMLFHLGCCEHLE